MYLHGPIRSVRLRPRLARSIDWVVLKHLFTKPSYLHSFETFTYLIVPIYAACIIHKVLNPFHNLVNS